MNFFFGLKKMKPSARWISFVPFIHYLSLFLWVHLSFLTQRKYEIHLTINGPFHGILYTHKHESMNILGHLFARSNTYCCCATTTTAATTSTMLLLRPRPLPNSANVYLFVGTAAAAAFLLFPLRINNNKKKRVVYNNLLLYLCVYWWFASFSGEKWFDIVLDLVCMGEERPKKLLRTLGI